MRSTNGESSAPWKRSPGRGHVASRHRSTGRRGLWRSRSDKLVEEVDWRGSEPTVVRIKEQGLDVDKKLSKQRKILAIQLGIPQLRRSALE